jgi:hypothetical protein
MQTHAQVMPRVIQVPGIIGERVSFKVARFRIAVFPAYRPIQHLR